MIGYAQGLIVNQRVVGVRVETWTKAIPQARDRWQSQALVLVVGSVLVMESIPIVMLSLHPLIAGNWVLRTGIVSLTFAMVVWALRAATPAAAFFGGVICLSVTLQTEHPGSLAEIHSGLTPLVALFVLTFLATKAGKTKKARIGAAESRRGRNAAQIIANLGAASLAMDLPLFAHPLLHQQAAVMLLGVLAEATADTVSSEIGAAFGGRPFLLTTFRRVDAGTDGAISTLGTLSGCVGAALVTTTGAWSMGLSFREASAAFAGGVLGLLFDSLLGATLERRGWLGNDWVNFASTVAGALTAAALTTWAFAT